MNKKGIVTKENMLLFDTLLDILSEGDESRCPPEKLSEVIRKINYINVINEVKDAIKTDSYDKIKKSIESFPNVDPDASSKFLISLSKTLNIDETTAIDLWTKYYDERYYITLPKDLQSLKSKLKTDCNSFELLDKIREFYFEQRSYFWKSLHELLRITLEDSHIYFNEASIVINTLLRR